MSWTTTKAYIATKIYTNGNEEVSAEMNKDAVNRIIDDLGDYKWGGVITPDSLFTKNTDQEWIFYANTTGTYANFGGGTLDHKNAYILYNGSFTIVELDNYYLPSFPDDASLVLKGDGTFGLITTPPNNYTYQPFTNVMGVVLTHLFGADPDIYFKDENNKVFEPLDVEYTDENTVTVTFDRLTTGSVFATIGSNPTDHTATTNQNGDENFQHITLEQVGLVNNSVQTDSDAKVNSATTGAIYDNGNSGTSKTITASNSTSQKITLDANCEVTLAAVTGSTRFSLKVIQDATGGRNMTFTNTVQNPSEFNFADGGANQKTNVTFFFDGEEWWLSAFPYID